MDETSIPYTMTHLPGCVAVKGTRLPRMAVRKQDMRGALTYVSVVCDMQHIQGKLPHYLFGSETKLTKKLLKGQHALPQTCLRVIRQKSAWTSSKNISMIVKDLAGVLKNWPDLQAILLLDVASPHLAKEVMEAARLNQVQPLYIPAGLTDKLQPLDLTAFHSFKTHLKRRYQALRAGSFEAGLVDPLAWLFELMECPRKFFAAKRWKRTFWIRRCIHATWCKASPSTAPWIHGVSHHHAWRFKTFSRRVAKHFPCTAANATCARVAVTKALHEEKGLWYYAGTWCRSCFVTIW